MEEAFQKMTQSADVCELDSCCYCGISDAKYLIQCKECQKWFCNWNGKLHMSHIVMHLMQSSHREVTMNKEGPLRGKDFKCSLCDCRNVFQLGYVSIDISSTTPWFCRLPCALKAERCIEDKNKDLFDCDVTDLWKPLISDHSFSFMVVDEPAENVIKNARPLSLKRILKLEDLWEVDKTASFADVIKSPSSAKLERVSLRYESTKEYLSVFAPLVKLEAEYDKNKRKLLSDTKFDVEWEVSKAGRIFAYFKLASMNEDVHLMHGSRISMKYLENKNGCKKSWSGVGYVCKIPKNLDGVIGICLQRGSIPPINCTTGFTVSSVFNPTAYLRMHRALQKFSTDEACVSIYIFRWLLGHNVEDVSFKCRMPTDFYAPSLPTLNESQVSAVKHALKKSVSLIQGPPGTGKTVTSASLVYHLVRQNGSQILVCAPSNTAVDHLAEKLSLTGLNVVRLCCKSREAEESPLPHIALHHLVRNRQPDRLKELQRIKDEIGKLSTDDDTVYKNLLFNCEQAFLKDAEVICCTCSSAGDPRLHDFVFNTVLIDESTQATEPECLIPIVKGIKQIILVGDHCQLGPTVICPKAAAAGLGTSLFQRFLMLGSEPSVLNQQYRMHPELSKFPSNLFYDGALLDGVSENERQCDTGFPWPMNKPMFFYVTHGREEISATGHSFLNRTETKLVEQIVAKFLSLGVNAKQIGVITPYDGQKTHILQYMQLCGSLDYTQYQDLEISSVDGFQGREKDFIILSCVRSNKSQRVGFLTDPRRLNVAITRARLGLIILGDAKVLAKHPLWNHLLTYYQEQNVVMEGSLDNLQHSDLQFGKPEKLVNKLNPRNHFMNFAVFESSSAIIPGNF